MNMLRNANLCRQAVAIFTLLAMLVAPLCASLCGSRTCASLSSTQSDDCHSSLAANDGATRTGIASIRDCGSREFPTAALNETTSSPDPVKKDPAVHASSNFVPAQSVPLLANGVYNWRADNERCITSSSVQPTVLRI
jgi:hypothetical protein